MTLRKRFGVLLTVVTVVLGMALLVHAQSRTSPLTPITPVTPTVLSNGDIGFRLLGMRGKLTPVGQWVVRIDGVWLVAESGGDPYFQAR
jgi:hypothetical protein